jgi:hypothetical protein
MGIIKSIFALCVLTLLVVQLVMTMPQARDALAEQMSGMPASNAVRVGVTLGELVLTLEGVQPTNNIKVLQNGIPISVFNQRTISVMVEDNSLIEIDGSNTREGFRVILDSHSENVELFNGATEVALQENIAILDRILVNEQF